MLTGQCSLKGRRRSGGERSTAGELKIVENSVKFIELQCIQNTHKAQVVANTVIPGGCGTRSDPWQLLPLQPDGCQNYHMTETLGLHPPQSLRYGLPGMLGLRSLELDQSMCSSHLFVKTTRSYLVLLPVGNTQGKRHPIKTSICLGHEMRTAHRHLKLLKHSQLKPT